MYLHIAIIHTVTTGMLAITQATSERYLWVVQFEGRWIKASITSIAFVIIGFIVDIAQFILE